LSMGSTGSIDGLAGFFCFLLINRDRHINCLGSDIWLEAVGLPASKNLFRPSRKRFL
jgi:hypothetical protein